MNILCNSNGAFFLYSFKLSLQKLIYLNIIYCTKHYLSKTLKIRHTIVYIDRKYEHHILNQRNARQLSIHGNIEHFTFRFISTHLICKADLKSVILLTFYNSESHSLTMMRKNLYIFDQRIMPMKENMPTTSNAD